MTMMDESIVTRVAAHMLEWMEKKKLKHSERLVAISFMQEFMRAYNEIKEGKLQ